MKLKLLVSRATADGPQQCGDVVDVPDAEGLRMVAAGQAEAPDEQTHAAAAELANTEAVEAGRAREEVHAAKRRRSKRPKSGTAPVETASAAPPKEMAADDAPRDLPKAEESPPEGE